MIRKIFEEYKEILLYSLIALFVGIIIGGIDAVFGEVLIKITEVRSNHVIKLIPFLPIAGVMIILLYRYCGKESIKGMTLIFQAGHGEIDHIPKRLVPLVIISTWITHIFGGSAGREGVAVQLGATVAHTISKKLKWLNNSRVLLVIGMAAGFAGLFQTPIAATFFAMEVLVSGIFLYEVLLPALVASFAASTTSHLLGLEKFSVDIPNTLSFSSEVLFKLVLVGIIFGIVGGIFAYLLSYCKKKFALLIENPVKRIFIIGCILSVLFILLHMGRYCGLGTNLINISFTNGQIYEYDWVLKLVLTVLTLAAGFQGGEVTPLFSIGASLGVVLGSLLGLPMMLIAALGYAAVFGSATNTLLAPILIGAEVFGAQNTLYFAVVCSLAFIFNGNKTIYTAQKRFSFFSSEGMDD
ncbi:MAG: voltage-gated chloride channel protein [Clostridia bacterium]|nr:voltage-gated chloride channel protein [Clostridia bacterium]